MIKKINTFSLLLLLSIIIFSSACLSNNTSESTNKQNPVSRSITVYKSPTCGCCGEYVSYLEQKGVTLIIEETNEVETIKEQNSIPREMWSCHTMLIDGYFVEGHVPVEAINKLIHEKPDIDGIALPGMPIGTPGMPGQKTAPFVIYSINDDSIMEYMVI